MTAPPNYYDEGIRTNFFQLLYYKWRTWSIKRFLLGTNMRFLDVGCHSGTFTKEMAKSLPKAEVYGVDIDQAAIDYAKKKRPKIKFKVAAAEKLPFPKESFDLITCLHVLEHVRNPEKALSEMNRCLKKEGKLIIEVPTESWLFRLVWFFWVRTRGKVWQGGHLQNFNGSRIDDLLRRKDFEVEEQRNSHLGTIRTYVAKKVTV